MAHDPNNERPLIVHVVYRFAVGGLENGVVNLINRLPADRWRHAVVSLTDVSRDFCKRVQRTDVTYIELDKPPGHGYRLYPRLYRLMRELRPAVVHTRNLAALEAVVPAWAARVPVRVHGEHGRDTSDLDGSSKRYQRLRRFYSPFVSRYIALSKDLESYLAAKVGIAPKRIAQIYNGVDTVQFHPARPVRETLEGCPFNDPRSWIVGTVGRMEVVKGPENLARAFVRALEIDPAARERLRLVMVGDGRLKRSVESILAGAGASDLAWLPGERSDVARILRGFDCFVLPSLAEGISNTILEAMATGLPVLATRVGGNAELIDEGRTGALVPAGEIDAMANAILAYFNAPNHAIEQGKSARLRVEQRFSLDAMVDHYDSIYRELLDSSARRTRFASVA